MRLSRPTAAPPSSLSLVSLVGVLMVIMVTFMALASRMKEEHLFRLVLPGCGVIHCPAYELSEEGEVLLGNGDELLFDGKEEDVGTWKQKLSALSSRLARLNELHTKEKTFLSIHVVARDSVPYERMTDVMNALKIAGIRHVDFGTTSEE